MLKRFKKLFVSDDSDKGQNNALYQWFENQIMHSVEENNQDTNKEPISEEYIATILKRLRNVMNYKQDIKPHELDKFAKWLRSHFSEQEYSLLQIGSIIAWARSWLMVNKDAYPVETIEILNAVQRAKFADGDEGIKTTLFELLKEQQSKEAIENRSHMHAPVAYKRLYSRYKSWNDEGRLKILSNIQFIEGDTWTRDIYFSKLWITLKEWFGKLSLDELKKQNFKKYSWKIELPTQQDLREMIQAFPWDDYVEDAVMFLDCLKLDFWAQIHIKPLKEEVHEYCQINNDRMYISNTNRLHSPYLFVIKRDWSETSTE